MRKTTRKRATAFAGSPGPAERRSSGKRQRDSVPRAEQGRWSPPAARPNPAQVLIRANQGREPALLALKWARMSKSPFAFFRGAASLMAADLARLPRTGLYVQMCGDAHAENLGAFAGADGRVIFDLNDFDETTPGPWEWDVKRLATSLVVLARETKNGDRQGLPAARAFVASYRQAMGKFQEMGALELGRLRVQRGPQAGPVAELLRKAERETPQATLERLTVAVGRNRRRFHDRPPVIRHVADREANGVLRALESYKQTLGPAARQILSRYRAVDVAFKVVGTGSVGTQDYVVLLFGNHDHDWLFLQVKEARASCYAPFLKQGTAVSHQGRRVAEGQQLLQSSTDPLVGWTTLRGRDFLVRQLSDHKASVDEKSLRGAALVEYAIVCGEVLAKAHARTGDACAIFGYCGKNPRLDKAIGKFAVAYADQNERDFSQFTRTIRHA